MSVTLQPLIKSKPQTNNSDLPSFGRTVEKAGARLLNEPNYTPAKVTLSLSLLRACSRAVVKGATKGCRQSTIHIFHNNEARRLISPRDAFRASHPRLESRPWYDGSLSTLATIRGGTLCNTLRFDVDGAFFFFSEGPLWRGWGLTKSTPNTLR